MIAESCVELSKLIMEVVEFNHAMCLPSLASVCPPPRSRKAALLSASGAMWLNPTEAQVVNQLQFLIQSLFQLLLFFF